MKKNITIPFIFVFALILSFQAKAQDTGFKKADKYYNNLSYVKAIRAYEEIPDKSAGVYRNLAKSYLVLGNTEKAEENYARLLNSDNYKPDDIYDYASVLLMNKKYDEAKQWLAKYAKQSPDDERAKLFLKDPDYLKKLMQSNQKVVLMDAGINTKYEDFGPAYYENDKVVFASSRVAGLSSMRKWRGNNQSFINLFSANLTEDDLLSGAKKFTKIVNRKLHDGPVAFNKTSDYMVITRNIYDKGKVSDNKLWLYDSSKQTDGSWSKPHPLHFNSKAYQCGHAALSGDAQTMYFVSDMPGGVGKTDLYVVHRKQDGAWGNPKHLKMGINTRGKEMFPYLSPDGEYLFFSSNGLPGLGGLDIFVARIKKDGSLTNPVNLGTPINSSMDDFAMIYKTKGVGFISSNRSGGHGDDDIYAFKNLTKFKKILRKWVLSGTVADRSTKDLIGNAIVDLYDTNGKKINSYITEQDGRYNFLIIRDKDYKLKVRATGYNPAEGAVTSRNNEGQVVKNFLLDTNKTPSCDFKIAPLYYDLDRYHIKGEYGSELDYIIKLMNKYPKMRLKVISHTDCRASSAYNMKLSKNRTNSVVKYLIRKGIDENRLIPQWRGESELVNGCSDGVKCSEAEHQLNRRTEFVVENCK